MFSIFETIKVCILGAVLISAIAFTWTIQNWRWEAKQTAALKHQAEQTQTEANKEANAATKFENKEAKRNDKYDKLTKNLDKGATSPSAPCLSPNSLHIINNALSRKTANSG